MLNRKINIVQLISQLFRKFYLDAIKMKKEMKNQVNSNDQIIFQSHIEHIPFQRKQVQYCEVNRVIELPKRKEIVEYVQVERLDSQKRIVVEKIPRNAEVIEYEVEHIVEKVPQERIIQEIYLVEYKSCSRAVLDKLRLSGHKQKTAAIIKNQDDIEEIKKSKEVLSQDLAQQLKEYMEKNNKLILQLQEEIKILKNKVNEIDAKLSSLKLLQKYLMPKIKIKEKLSDLKKKNQPQFIYIRCLHRSLNSFFQSVLLSKSNYLQVNNPHEYTNVKKIASKISQFVEDIPVVSTIFSVTSTSLTFVLEAKEQLKLEETKAKVEKLVSVSSGDEIDEDTQKLSISILDSLIKISSIDQKMQEMKTATQNPKNFQSYRDLSWIEQFSEVYDSLRAAIARGNKSKSQPELTSLYADWDYAKIMKCLFDLDESKINNLHDLLSQALDPSLQKQLTQSQQTKKDCCQCALM